MKIHGYVIVHANGAVMDAYNNVVMYRTAEEAETAVDALSLLASTTRVRPVVGRRAR